ncbi:TPR-like protein [Xylariaceae sp. FL0016]|nr:TPR-like protein [Xylariaceae sp. FL0016]
MVQIEEISDEVAERLKLEQAQAQPSPQPQQVPADATAPAPPPSKAPTPPKNAHLATSAMFPELSPGRAMTDKMTVDEVVADLKKTPFFMTELEENDETEALKALAYEGTPLENAADFKERGNECFKAKRWGDAKEFYTKGVLILAAEERKRKGLPVESMGDAKENDESTPAPEEEIQSQRSVLESLYVNRAACHLELRNYRSCWLDGAAALRINDKNIKAYYRSAKALLAVGRIEEADDACARGLAVDENNASLKAVARDIIKRAEEITAKQRVEAERAAKEKRRAMLIKAALRAREIKTRATPQPPEMEDAGIRLVPDPDSPESALAFPTVLLYPANLESDFIKQFNETDTLSDHLGYVFPLPWDTKRKYTVASVECYMETVEGGLIKVGKKAPLMKMLFGAKVEVVDEVVKIFVLPKDKAAGWIADFKKAKATEKGQN